MSTVACPLKGPWSRAEVERYLDDTVIPIRLSVVAASGWPIVLSLWFMHENGVLLCATQESASVVRAIETDGRCAFEVAGDAPPYRGVRGRGRVTIEKTDAPRVLGKLIDRFLPSRETPLAQWLLGRVEREVCLRIEPTTLSTWDYSGRM